MCSDCEGWSGLCVVCASGVTAEQIDVDYLASQRVTEPLGILEPAPMWTPKMPGASWKGVTQRKHGISWASKQAMRRHRQQIEMKDRVEREARRKRIEEMLFEQFAQAVPFRDLYLKVREVGGSVGNAQRIWSQEFDKTRLAFWLEHEDEVMRHA